MYTHYSFAVELLYRVLLFAKLGFYLFIRKELPFLHALKDMKYLPTDSPAPFSFNLYDNLRYTIIFIPGFIEQSQTNVLPNVT